MLHDSEPGFIRTLPSFIFGAVQPKQARTVVRPRNLPMQNSSRWRCRCHQGIDIRDAQCPRRRDGPLLPRRVADAPEVLTGTVGVAEAVMAVEFVFEQLRQRRDEGFHVGKRKMRGEIVGWPLVLVDEPERRFVYGLTHIVVDASRLRTRRFDQIQ